MSELDRARAGRYVAARRGRLGLTQERLAERAGIDRKTVYHLEEGKRWPRATTRAAIEQVLGWADGDLLRIATGSEPVPDPRELLVRLVTDRAAELGRNATTIAYRAGILGSLGQPLLDYDLTNEGAALLDRVLRWEPGSARAAFTERRPPVPLPEKPRVGLADVLGLSQDLELRRLPAEESEEPTTGELLAQARQLLQELQETVYSRPAPDRTVRAVRQYQLAVEALEEELGDAG